MASLHTMKITMDKRRKVNPLNVFGMRRVNFCPPHFESANVELTYNMIRAIEQWIDENIKGRFFLGQRVIVDPNVSDVGKKKIKYTTLVSFENSKDLSYFLLACPYLKY